jgi:acyl carrier protein
MLGETLEDRVERLVLEYAQSLPAARPLDRGLSLRNDLVIESLSLVSLTLRLGDELGVDLVEAGLELGDVKTVGDLVSMAHAIERTKNQETINREMKP